MPKFDLQSAYQPSGDQPQAIEQLTRGVLEGERAQTLLGVTGSGKTFTIANVIKNVDKPTLVLSHNKALAAQLYQEFKGFFPNNAVEYYVSYYDYYQPEAYKPSTDTYIEKDLAINQEIDKLRLAATSSLLSGRRDIIVVASISCIYGMGNPAAFYENVIELQVDKRMERNHLLRRLVDLVYVRNDIAPQPGNFSVKGDSVFVHLAYSDDVIRIRFWDDIIDAIDIVNGISGHKLYSLQDIKIYPAKLFLTTKEATQQAIRDIQDDLVEQEALFRESGKLLEAQRLHERVTYDLEMIRDIGYCSGIENYSRYFDGRKAGTRPFCLLDFFPEDFLMIIDESHVSVGQIGQMYGGDRSRKLSLVEYGFRLPAALDNRPLKEEEFWNLVHQTIFVSATPAEFELEQSGGVVVEQVIRPTGLLDPEVQVRPSINQLDDLTEEIRQRIERDERVLVTTITQRMAEDLATYFVQEVGIPANYMHAHVKTLDRVQILNDLRSGAIKILVGVNLLREGLDLPEVSLVAILDADKEGFLRSNRSLTQTAGRAARNVNGLVILYADRITHSMQEMIDETQRRRRKQMEYNRQHGITPKQIQKAINSDLIAAEWGKEELSREPNYLVGESETAYEQGSFDFQKETIESLERKMNEAAKKYDFIQAAQYRDAMLKLKELQGK